MPAPIIATKTLHMIPGRLRITVEGSKRDRVFSSYLFSQLKVIAGIKSASVNYLTGRALIYYEIEKLSLADIQQQIDIIRRQFLRGLEEAKLPAAAAALCPELGTTKPANEIRNKEKEGEAVPRFQLINTVVTGGVLAGIVFKRLVMGRSLLSTSQRLFNFTAIVTIVAGYPVLRSGIANLVEKRRVNNDLLISVASLILLAMRENIAGLSVLWLVQLSGLFNYIMHARSRRAVREILIGKQSKVVLANNEGYQQVDTSDLSIGDIIVVRQGEHVVVDGVVVDGKAVLNKAAICGEYIPVEKNKGDEVSAGMVVEEGTILVQAVRVGKDTSVASIIALIEQASDKNGISRSGEIYSGKLVPWTIGIAAAIFLLTRDYQRSLAVLLAGCPAAVALSSHTALGMSVAQAASQGIFIKDSRSIEAAEQIDTVLFDKTGTLTQVKPQLSEIVVLGHEYTEDDILALAAALEKSSSHPIARMLYHAARSKGLMIPEADTKITLGNGIIGNIGAQELSIGNEELMRSEGISTEAAKGRTLRFKHLGNSVVYVAINRKLAALVGIEDILRPESISAIEGIRSAGISDIGLITGDTTDSAAAAAAKLGLSQNWGGMQAADKVEIITKIRQDGKKVAMVGDGLNDSPAMSAADLSIAVGSAGTDLAVRTADVVICGNDLSQIPAVLELSKKTMQVMRQNVTFSAGASAVGIGLAAMQIMSPVTAALFLNLSTLGVVLNSARLLMKRRPQNNTSPAKSINNNVLDLQRFAQTPTSINAASQPNKLLHLPLNQKREINDHWHVLPEASICEKLGSSARFGLNEQTAIRRCEENGLNVLAEGKKISFWQLFRDQFKDFMVKVLLGSTVLSFVLGDVKDAILTGSILIANALLGAYQESKAEKSLDSIKKMTPPMARVIRGGRTQSIKAEYLVPGDLIILEAGDRIPADARLIKATQFEVEEASLTGETIPAKKKCSQLCDEDATLGDRSNMVFMGTNVTRGRAHAIVVATGMSTEMGKIAALLQNRKNEPTPLQIRLEELGKIIVVGCLSVAGIVFLTGILRGQSLFNMVRSSATIAVTAIPEGLSAIVIVALALGVRRMVKQNILVRNMASIETLGCATVICSDKTGTLTKNEMTVRKIYTAASMWDIDGEGYCPKGKFYQKQIQTDPREDAALMQTLLTGVLCNNSKLVSGKETFQNNVVAIDNAREKGWSINGDPTEGALLVVGAKAGIWEHKLEQSYVRVKELPFEAERRKMSVVCKGHNDENVLYSKGAPDSIISACTHYLVDGEVRLMCAEVKQTLHEACENMANDALRVLATAYKVVDDFEEDDDSLETGLIFSGLVGMIDPPRPEVLPAIAKCKKAGVKVVMITGDHPSTAMAISRELGLLEAGGRVLTGQELDKMSDDQLTDVIESISVYARTAPQHKMRIIKSFKSKGYVVAMTGDGVNDAPAIKAADIGIAMGITGTDVTKDAACMTLADDNFATIVRAMQEGRAIYANIRKAIRYALATNIGEVVLMFLAALIGLPLPLLPIQLLWINLIGDGLPVIALVNDPPAEGIMEQPPRSGNDSVFSGNLGRKILTRGAIIGAAGLALYAWKLRSTGSLILARSLVVAQIAVSQFVHIFDCRKEDRTGKVSFFSNWALLGAVGLSMAMVAGIIYIPALQTIFGTTGLTALDWMLVSALSIGTAFVDYGAENVLARISPNKDSEVTCCLPAPMAAE
ncbi:heavy metal translocating P-type ATPase [Dendrosporobacter sp. 1207_IL3150]|uniref:heavy metal translocating P-type ATPase n=1 Tax=Dendrosporobacter sp. 1207_IL3150 TaxID=3084054 RepID=UPI002FD9FAD1